ncbi:metal ABC transporter substrate-binding protein [Aerococcus agrisoli]|uniref:Metal ABC transporter substrate-binding protein n=1 Tax=Aerococcus agrisoli TaxID=2487350 RepID=A0A3N4GQP9_9LACT|nr:MetQ/NlpA family ABC transporter substrate-binding protein [Aerococcus agrisoli]RPA60940.1 metal ABC transporter substrate-binding protein [Aerococcus agrisoli]
MKKSIWITSAIALILAGCGNADAQETVTVASRGSDVDTWEFIADSDAVKEADLAIEVVSMEGDGVQTNQATAEQEVDVNAFQNLSYMYTFNENSDTKLVPIATTYREPMGVYSDKYEDISEVSEGDSVSVGVNSATQARQLLVLQGAGLITLSDDFDPDKGTVEDITENPLNLAFVQIDELQLARSLQDVDFSVIGNTLALEAGLNVTKDAIYIEELDENTNGTINVIATVADRADDETLQKLGDLYHSDEVQKFVAEEFEGTKIEVEVPVADVWTGE